MTERSEIAHEQAQIDTLYARLDELRAETRASLSSVRRSKVGGHHQNRSERDAFATMYEDALIRYQSAEDGLCFGRSCSWIGVRPRPSPSTAPPPLSPAAWSDGVISPRAHGP